MCCTNCQLFITLFCKKYEWGILGILKQSNVVILLNKDKIYSVDNAGVGMHKDRLAANKGVSLLCCYRFQ